MKTVKAIVFDLGGVLVNLNYYLTELKFKELGVSNFSEMFTQAQQTHLFDLYETGKISSPEFLEGLRKLSGLAISDADLTKAWNAMLLDFPIERFLFLQKVKEKFPIYLLSNTNHIHINEFERQLNHSFGYANFRNVFNKVYYSYEVGLRKPNADIFQLVLDENKYAPHEVLFIDDSIQHVKGAASVGMNALHLEVKEMQVMDLLAKNGWVF